jgi:hypothetical protein
VNDAAIILCRCGALVFIGQSMKSWREGDDQNLSCTFVGQCRHDKDSLPHRRTTSNAINLAEIRSNEGRTCK